MLSEGFSYYESVIKIRVEKKMRYAALCQQNFISFITNECAEGWRLLKRTKMDIEGVWHRGVLFLRAY